MLCTRCSHPLKPRADRCLRCFALNPQNCGQEPLKTAGRLDFRIDSPPPSAYRSSGDLTSAELDSLAGARARRAAAAPQLGLSFPQDAAPEDREDADGPSLDAAPEEREDAAGPSFDAASEGREDLAPPPPAAARKRVGGDASSRLPGSQNARKGVPLPLPSSGARLVSWGVDAGLVLACAAGHVAVAAALVGPKALALSGAQPLDTWADLFIFGRRLPFFWAALAAAVALAYSWIFMALGGQTPGMWIAGLRLVRVGRIPGGQVSAPRALVRAMLALPSLGLGSFGFVLALVDARGQTLHDKLAGCMVIQDSWRS
jgi:uncharacterized RDD family membrane protein YckC